MPSPDKEVISFYLGKELVKELDKCARSVHMNRSQFLEWLLTKALPLTKQVAKAMNDVFKTVKTEQKVVNE